MKIPFQNLFKKKDASDAPVPQPDQTSSSKSENNFFSKFIFIFQKEVADRIIAKENSKNYGRLSILSTWKMEKLKIFDIKNVDGGLIGGASLNAKDFIDIVNSIN